MQRGGIFSPVPWARHILGWMFKAEEFGTKQLLRQLKAANVLSYAAVEDIITTGIVRPSAWINLQEYSRNCSICFASSEGLPLCTLGMAKMPVTSGVIMEGFAWRSDSALSMQADVLAKFRTEELSLPSNFIQNNYVRARKLHSIPFM